MQSHLRWFLLIWTGFVTAVLPFGGQIADPPGPGAPSCCAPRSADLWLQDSEVGSAAIFSSDTGDFPTIRAFFSVHDAQGQFIRGLRSSQVTVLEDGQPRPVERVAEQSPGAQLAVAINPGRAFAIRDGLGFSRYERLVEGLVRWAEAHPQSSQDDLSLVITNGPEALHTSSAEEWLDSLLSYESDMRSAEPSLEVLDLALEVAADPPVNPGMGRGVLFITPQSETGTIVGLQNIAVRSRQAGVKIFVWLIGSPESVESPAAAELRALAESTGGQFFLYSGVEPVPNLESYLDELRYVYELAYESGLASAGVHQVAVEVRVGEDRIASPPVGVELDIQPPRVAFVSPPSEIRRQLLPVEGAAAAGQFSPTMQDIEVQVEFPDGFERTVLTSTLIVDGLPVAVNSMPPFDRFTWDISPYAESGGHILQVEVIDKLGITAASNEITIAILVEYPTSNVLAAVSDRAPLVAVLVVVLAGAILGVVLIVGGRLNPQAIGRRFKPNLGAGRRVLPPRRDPLTDLLSNEKAGEAQPSGRGAAWLNRFHRSGPAQAPKAAAYLTPLSEQEGKNHASPIPLTGEEITIGRDADKVSVVVGDASVEPLHARLKKEDNVYRISDEGSVAGTWVNYTPVSREGMRLEHGDLVHVGKAGFRFSLREPNRVRKPVVTPIEEESQ